MDGQPSMVAVGHDAKCEVASGAVGFDGLSCLCAHRQKVTQYREGFAAALRWMLERFNLDSEDEDALNEALENGPWE